MNHTISLTLLLFASTAIAEETPNTVFIEFENERQPTADAGVGPGMDVVREGEYLYMLQESHLVVLTVKDPARPTVIGRLENIGNLRQIVVRGNVAYITAREDGLFVVDVSDRTTPKLWSHYDTIEFATGIAIKDQYAFVAQRWFGVEIVDVTDGSQTKRAKLERSWGGLVHYRQLCNGFIDGKYICGTWSAGRTFMSDLSGDEPTNLPDPTGILPDMSRGGYCACGQWALVTIRIGPSCRDDDARQRTCIKCEHAKARCPTNHPSESLSQLGSLCHEGTFTDRF